MMNTKVTKQQMELALSFANTWERASAILDDMRDIEPTSDLASATLQGLARELSAQTVSMICTLSRIQESGRVHGYNIEPKDSN